MLIIFLLILGIISGGVFGYYLKQCLTIKTKKYHEKTINKSFKQDWAAVCNDWETLKKDWETLKKDWNNINKN